MAVSHDLTGITGVTQDSRMVKPGYLFAAFPGEKTDGRDFIPMAVANGAAVVLVPTGTRMPDGVDVSVIEEDNPRQAFARITAGFYGAQPDVIAAVTGTNGKTSVAHFVRQLWESGRGYKSASIGTLGIHGTGVDMPGAMTTPDTVSLHEGLADLVGKGVTHVVMEASSHGLDQYRLDGVRVSAAGFTNLSRDHMDYHGDMDAYFASKGRLFRDVLSDDGVAVLNADIPEFSVLQSDAEKRGISVLSYGLKGRDITLVEASPAVQGQRLVLEVFGERHIVNLPLAGLFQAMNVLCALGLAVAGDKESLPSYIQALSGLSGVPGRMQLVDGHPAGAVYIDYAHTPDALETVLKALRPHAIGDLVCVFGCGGDRDTGKRPVMGEVAVRLADRVIVTDDNPRSEDPASIRASVLDGAKGAEEIEGRRRAIGHAVRSLKEGDVLVIAGKGHEQGQIFADRTEEFDDYREAKNAIEEL